MEPEPEIATKPPKRPRSEAQKKATENALNILKARREAKKEEKIRAAAPTQVTAPSTEYVTKKDLEAYLANMKPKVKAEKVRPKKEPVYSSSSESEPEPEPEPVVRKKQEKPRPETSRPTPKEEPAKLTGYQLLDAIIFSRR